MRITDIYGKLNERSVESTGQKVPAGQSPKTGGAGGQPAAGSPSGEKVTLSAEAQKLADQSAAAAETEKIGKLRASIENGTFKVDPQAIAKRLVEGG